MVGIVKADEMTRNEQLDRYAAFLLHINRKDSIFDGLLV
jgi:hypothetical protein